jgi:putative endonuclease
MKIFTVYMVICSDDSYYVGLTNDITRRIQEHNEGENPKAFTYRRRPVKLAFSYDCIDGHEAHALEKQIKGWRREKKKALIEGRWEDLPELSKA